MAETFKLPCSSYEELIKLFQAYANTKEGTALSLDEITQATGVPRTIVSKNNGFMVQVGLITEGNKKAATETGRALGRAYTSKITDEVERIWKEIIAEVDFLNRIVKAKLFCPEIAGLFCRIAGLFCHDSRANLSLKPVCFGIAIS